MSAEDYALAATDKALLDEIEQLNLSALVLAQSLLKSSKDEAMLRFGLDEASAQLLSGLSVRQLQLLSKAPYFLFPVRFDHKAVWEILSRSENFSRTLAHAMIAGAGSAKGRSEK